MNRNGPTAAYGKCILGMIGLAFLWTQSARSETVSLRTESTDQQLRLLFRWPSPVDVESSLEGRELLLRFSRAMDCPEAEALPTVAPSWIEAVSRGFDSLLLRTARDVEFSVLPDGACVTLLLTPSVLLTAAAEAEKEQGLLRLQLLKVRLLIETDRIVEAHRLLGQLADRHPGNPLVMVSRASFEERSGRWRRADGIYDEALRLAPGNEDILEARRNLVQDFRSGVEVEMGPKTVTDAWDEFRIHVRGTMFLRNHLRAGFTFSQNHVTVGALRGPTGDFTSVDANRQQMEMYLHHDTEGGARVKGSLYANSKTAGVGFQWSRPGLTGTTEIQLHYRRPFWEFIESIVDAGTRDRLEAARQQSLTPKLNGWVIGAYNRYRLDGGDHVASSGSFNAGLDYMFTKRPLLGLQYGFDGEYRSTIETRRDPSGIRYFPIPLYSREVHSLTLHFGADLGGRLHAQGFGGYSKDRLGGSGPFFGANAFYRLSREFDLKLDFERRLNSVNTGEVVYQLFGQLIWKKR